MEKDYQQHVKAIKNNYPPERYSMLREALNCAIELMTEPQLDESQLWHLNKLMAHYEELKENQPYPIYYGLLEYLSGDDGPEIEDKEHAQVIQIFLNRVIKNEN